MGVCVVGAFAAVITGHSGKENVQNQNEAHSVDCTVKALKAFLRPSAIEMSNRVGATEPHHRGTVEGGNVEQRE